jgi:hypothetical protein
MLVKLLTGVWRIDASGRWYPNIQGGDGDENDTDDDDNTDDTDEKPKTFTQRDLDRIAAKEKREGRKAASRELMDKFGFDSLEDAERFFEEAKSRDTKADDDAEKRLRKAEERERKAEDRYKLATRKGNEADVLASLIGEGMPKAKAARAVRMVDLDLATEDLTADEIDEAVFALKEEMPELFGEQPKAEDEKEWRPIGSPDSTARGGQRRRPQSLTNAEKARVLLEQRHPEFAKTKT